MAHSLIQVGNSKAIIIPAKIIHRKKYTDQTEFDIVETDDGIRLIHRKEALDFPKINKIQPSPVVHSLMGSVSFSPEEIEEDERLKDILSR